MKLYKSVTALKVAEAMRLIVIPLTEHFCQYAPLRIFLLYYSLTSIPNGPIRGSEIKARGGISPSEASDVSHWNRSDPGPVS